MATASSSNSSLSSSTHHIHTADILTDPVRKMVVGWLVICAGLVFLMVLLGGTVRLTGSGLSMVDWNLLMGMIPPLNTDAWMAMFEKYKRFPEYQLVNYEMTLAQFKFIFLMEYIHRMLGRLIGMVFILPFIYFVLARRLNAATIYRLFALLALGALQGGLGWYMVKSGLVDDPHVSQYRLTLHLMVAVLIYAYMVRVIVGLLPHFSISKVDQVGWLGKTTLGVVLLMITTGGLVAGTRAGFIFNTYPKMGGQWIPEQLISLSPLWLNFTENPVAIQFIHRWLAIVVLVFALSFAVKLYTRYRDQAEPLATRLALALGISVVVQVCLGIATLLLSVPVTLGVIHQGGALVVLTFVILILSATLPKFSR